MKKERLAERFRFSDKLSCSFSITTVSYPPPPLSRTPAAVRRGRSAPRNKMDEVSYKCEAFARSAKIPPSKRFFYT